MRGEPPSQIGDEGGRDDDWLAGEGDLDWFDDLGGEEEPGEWPQGEQTRSGLVRAPVRGAARPGPEVERRRRMLFLGALVAGVALLIVVIVLATGGGDGGTPTVAATTAQATQPATTPTPTTTQGTTTTTTTTPSLHVTIPDGGNLSVGDSGSQVVTLQKALTELGYDVGTADGDFGQRTADAVIAFQQAHDLNPDGIVGSETAQAMNDALAAAGQ